MKLYYFNPNDYGIEYFVMADSEENAIKSLNKHLISNGGGSRKWGDPYFKGYTIDVYEPGQVIESEIA
jgi:hypothetical protein